MSKQSYPTLTHPTEALPLLTHFCDVLESGAESPDLRRARVATELKTFMQGWRLHLREIQPVRRVPARRPVTRKKKAA